MDLRIFRRAMRLPATQVTQPRRAYLHFFMPGGFPRRRDAKPSVDDAEVEQEREIGHS